MSEATPPTPEDFARSLTPAGADGEVVAAVPTPHEKVQEEFLQPALDAIRAGGVQAYFEKLARTEPRTYLNFLKFLIGDSATARGATQANQTIVNVVSPIGRSALDELPPGFRRN